MNRRPVAIAAAAALVAVLALVFAAWHAWRPGAGRDAASGRAAARVAGAASTAPVASVAEVRAASADWGARVALLAGDGRIGHVDGAAARARFVDPYGIALDPHGSVFVADAGAIRVIRPDGTVATLAGGAVEGFADGPAATARFDTASGIAIDESGNLYVADTGNHAIRKLAPDGTVTTIAGDGHPGWRDGPGRQARFDAPVGVAVEAGGRVLVADTYNDRIRAIAPDGTVTTLAGGDAPGFADGPGAQARFDTPCGIAVDGRGRILVADARNDALRAIDAAGAVTTLAQAAPGADDPLLRRPLALAVDRDGGLVAAVAGGRLVRVSPQGVVRDFLDADDARFARPTAVAIGPGPRVLVADAAAARVHVLTPRPDAPAAAPVTSSAQATATAADVASAPAPLVAGPLGPAPDRAPPATARRWPLKPQDAWHEVVGTMGEDRGDGRGEPRDHFHDGLDVRGDVGQVAVAIADGTVDSPLAAAAFGRVNEHLVVGELGYVHLRVGRTAQGRVLDPARFQLWRDAKGRPAGVRVPRGTRFKAGDALGTINPMAHVHLWWGNGPYGRNPLALGFAGFRDHRAPTIASIEVRDAAGTRLAAREDGRLVLPRAGLRLVVDAFDQVDDNLPRRRLGLYSLGYQWLRADGTPLPGFEQPRTAIEFATLPPDSQVKLAYAEDSGVTVLGSKETHFRYQVASTPRRGPVAEGEWSTAELAPGDYVLRIVARDFSGNEAKAGRDLAVRIR